jgi:hypothetical protein
MKKKDKKKTRKFRRKMIVIMTVREELLQLRRSCFSCTKNMMTELVPTLWGGSP